MACNGFNLLSETPKIPFSSVGKRQRRIINPCAFLHRHQYSVKVCSNDNDNDMRTLR
ncbi:hypothetical protein L2097_09585 [Citrobacter sp. MNAZ 1397]|nr:hypothetical protein [Citrobacter sp. MNAZ 1397]